MKIMIEVVNRTLWKKNSAITVNILSKRQRIFKGSQDAMQKKAMFCVGVCKWSIQHPFPIPSLPHSIFKGFLRSAVSYVYLSRMSARLFHVEFWRNVMRFLWLGFYEQFKKKERNSIGENNKVWHVSDVFWMIHVCLYAEENWRKCLTSRSEFQFFKENT